MVLTSLVAPVAPHKQIHQSNLVVFEKENLLVYYTLYLGSANRQKSRWKIRVYIDEKLTFLKEPWYLNFCF